MLIENTLFGAVDKVQIALDDLRQHEPPEGYYVAFSGGKDSVTVLDLVKRAGVKFDAHYNIMTIEPPELISFIQQEYPEVILETPPASMFDLVRKFGFPPLRTKRYCCRLLKVHTGQDRYKVTGLRADESRYRKLRQKFEITRTGQRQLNLIIDWTEKDIWEYIRANGVKYCRLYDEGRKRLGCLFCPNSSKAQLELDLLNYPDIASQYIQTCEEAIRARLNKGLDSKYKTGLEMFSNWIDRTPKQTVNTEPTLF